MIIKESPHRSTTGDGPWISQPAKVRLSMDLRMLKSTEAADEDWHERSLLLSFCTGALGAIASFPNDWVI